MHDIKPVLKHQHSQHPRELLKHHYASFCQPEFWLPVARTLPEVHDLDLQLAASTTGDFAEGWRLAQKIEAEEPGNHRAAYNRGWYALRQGQIQKGYQLMDRGRIAGVFGDAPPNVPTPKWDGRTKCTVLLVLEGGLGDQIHQVRYAKDIAARGCRVVVACSGPLCALMAGVHGVSAVVQHDAAYGVYHDAWVAGMSAVVPLGFEMEDIGGFPYIDVPRVIKSGKYKIGLRWQGSSVFEKEHAKKFPAEGFFKALPRDREHAYVSLQRDAGAELCPDWVQPSHGLNSWLGTRDAIAACDLIITSCTSVAHLAGAMGIPTWVITPVMPYFLWASPGDSTPYYQSVRLLRQTTYGDWQNCFDEIKELLQ
jgi:hypothetical protein